MGKYKIRGLSRPCNLSLPPPSVSPCANKRAEAHSPVDCYRLCTLTGCSLITSSQLSSPTARLYTPVFQRGDEGRDVPKSNFWALYFSARHSKGWEQQNQSRGLRCWLKSGAWGRMQSRAA